MRRMWFFMFVVLLLVPAGCGRGQNDFSDVGVDVSLSPSPAEVGPARVFVTLKNASGAPIESAQVEVEGTVAGSDTAPVTAQAPEVDPGRYGASLVFGEAGKWFIVVRASLPDGRLFERKVDIGLVLSIAP